VTTIAELVQHCDDALKDHQRVTPGPWQWWTSNSVRRLSSPKGDGDVLHGSRHPIDGVVDIVGNEHDKNFIAAVRVREPIIADSLRELLKALETCFDNNGLSADGFIEILESNRRLRTKLGEACDLAETLLGDKNDPRIAELRQEATKR
jgi:hypothetical protein